MNDARLMPELPLAAVADPALYQYGTSEGEPAFREAVAEWISETGLKVQASQVLALAGSQQGLDFAAKLFIDEGTPMVTEAPTYVAALQVFELFGADLHTVPLTAEGPDLGLLEKTLDRHRPRCIYLIPCFQNPSGACYAEENRAAIAELLDHYEITLIEDEPYRSLAGLAPGLSCREPGFDAPSRAPQTGGRPAYPAPRPARRRALAQKRR